MPFWDEAVLVVLVVLVAILFASAGNAGAAGYLAAMGLVGMAPEVMRPTALVLNLVVALISAVLFMRAERLPLRLILPFAIGSIPMAYYGGSIQLPGTVYRYLLGVLFFFVAWMLVKRPSEKPTTEARPPPVVVMVAVGAGIGVIAGLAGIGGGIFLNPLLVLARWAEPRRAAGTTAAVNLVNSVAGLIGAHEVLRFVAPALPVLVVAAIAGGLIGATLGSKHLSGVALRRILAVLMVFVGIRMIVTA